MPSSAKQCSLLVETPGPLGVAGEERKESMSCTQDSSQSNASDRKVGMPDRARATRLLLLVETPGPLGVGGEERKESNIRL